MPGNAAAASLPLFDLRAVVQRNNGRARLRTLMADRRWHRAAELERVAGRRYGGRLHELRRGADGLPALDIEGRPRGRGDCEWEYRIVGEYVPGRNLDDGGAA